MNNPAENEICPHCGAPAVDLTTMDDAERRWLCIGAGAHEWSENDIFDEPEAPRPSLATRLLHRFSERFSF